MQAGEVAWAAAEVLETTQRAGEVTDDELFAEWNDDDLYEATPAPNQVYKPYRSCSPDRFTHGLCALANGGERLRWPELARTVPTLQRPQQRWARSKHDSS